LHRHLQENFQEGATGIVIFLLVEKKKTKNLGLGMVVHTYNPRYLEGRGRRIMVTGWPGTKLTTLKDKLKQKGLDI
jgi:hypothetical protein